MHVNTSHFKDFIHTRIRTPLGERGAFHLPIDATDDYCEMLVSESKIIKPNGKVIWVHDRSIGNHFLDAEVLAVAAAYGANLLNRRGPRPRSSDAAATTPLPEVPPIPAPMPRRRMPWVGPARGKNWIKDGQ